MRDADGDLVSCVNPKAEGVGSVGRLGLAMGGHRRDGRAEVDVAAAFSSTDAEGMGIHVDRDFSVGGGDGALNPLQPAK